MKPEAFSFGSQTEGAAWQTPLASRKPMIADSSYWKRELLRVATRLRRRQIQRRWHEASAASVEIDVMNGFYAIRKLAEAKKVSDDIVGRSLVLRAYPAIVKPVHRRNTHKIDELYDFEAPCDVDRPLAFVWNQVIHSYVFILLFSEDRRLNAVLFCSDRERHRFLYELTIAGSIALFEDVGNNDPASIHMVYNQKTQDWDVQVGPHLDEPIDAQ